MEQSNEHSSSIGIDLDAPDLEIGHAEVAVKQLIGSEIKKAYHTIVGFNQTNKRLASSEAIDKYVTLLSRSHTYEKSDNQGPLDIIQMGSKQYFYILANGKLLQHMSKELDVSACLVYIEYAESVGKKLTHRSDLVIIPPGILNDLFASFNGSVHAMDVKTFGIKYNS